MTLGSFIRGIGWKLQGNITVSVWDSNSENEIDRISFEYIDGGLNHSPHKDRLKGLLSLSIDFMFAQYGELVIEIHKRGDED